MNTGAVANQKSPLRIWTNPIGSELDELPNVVRFTATHSAREIYVWEYSCACHTGISVRIRLKDPYDSDNFLKSAAMRQPDGRFVMFQ